MHICPPRTADEARLSRLSESPFASLNAVTCAVFTVFSARGQVRLPAGPNAVLVNPNVTPDPSAPTTIGMLLGSGDARLAELSHLAVWSVGERRPLADIVEPSALDDALDSLRKAGRTCGGVELVASTMGADEPTALPRGCAFVAPLAEEDERRRAVLAHLLERRQSL